MTLKYISNEMRVKYIEEGNRCCHGAKKPTRVTESTPVNDAVWGCFAVAPAPRFAL